VAAGQALLAAGPVQIAPRAGLALVSARLLHAPLPIPHAVYGYEVSKVSVYQGRYIVGRTHATLLLVRRLAGGVEWHGPAHSLFCRPQPAACPYLQQQLRRA
jgi:hypothetical protein